jgi:hypothetical protein
MEQPSVDRRRITRAIRWIARGWTVVSIGVILLLTVGEGLYFTRLTEWLGFLFFPVGISVGMILAWRREVLGGSVTVGSLIVFYAIHLATAGTLPKGWAWFALSAQGLLFLLCRLLERAWWRSTDRV